MQYILTQEEYDELRDSDQIIKATQEYINFIEWLEESAQLALESMPKISSMSAQNFTPRYEPDPKYGMQQAFVDELLKRANKLKRKQNIDVAENECRTFQY